MLHLLKISLYILAGLAVSGIAVTTAAVGHHLWTSAKYAKAWDDAAKQINEKPTGADIWGRG